MIKQRYKMNRLKEQLLEKMFIGDPEQAIEEIMEYLCTELDCDRAYLFEFTAPNRVSNTYEHCRLGVTPQKELLQDESLEAVRDWWDMLEAGEAVVLEDIEKYRASSPDAYMMLESQEISDLVAVALRFDEKLIGFVGVDNPAADKFSGIKDFDYVTRALTEASRYISTLIKRRDIAHRMVYVSYHDYLTGFFNRHAYSEFVAQKKDCRSVGVVYADISGLKRTNDNMGHAAGDQLILDCSELMNKTFGDGRLYRLGGDEFVAISVDIPEELFQKKTELLAQIIENASCHMAIGSIWSDAQPIELTALVSEAELRMYENKAQYYERVNRLSARSRYKIKTTGDESASQKDHPELRSFLEDNYFDPVLFIKSVSMSDYYPYISDLKTNLSYISDEMRDIFGFQSNIVSDLFGVWESRIQNTEDLALFRKDVQELLKQEKDIHDLRYRVTDKNGDEIWIHCMGMIRWNENRTEPLFFSGGIVRQEKDFVVDPVTNFPREFGAETKLRELQGKGELTEIIGFALNNFSEINEILGRNGADELLSRISKKLIKEFGNKFYFCRLEGMRYIAISLPTHKSDPEKMITRMRSVIHKTYAEANISINIPCAMGLMKHIEKDLSAQEILVNMVDLLEMAKRKPTMKYLTHSSQNIGLQKQKTQMMMELNKNVLNNMENFRIVIQPTLSLEDATMSSGEVLLRWKYRGEDIPPDIFIPILEKNRLINAAGQWVFEQAVRICKRILRHVPSFKVGINISYHQVLDAEFIPFIEKTIKRYELGGEHLILEITETHYDEFPTKVYQFIESCKNMGIDVAIDDFGNAYASLVFLLKHPVGIVKLDRSLIREMVESKEKINFISSIVYACHKFGKVVCAEGVETEEELKIIQDVGCDLLQGFYYCRPTESGQFYQELIKLQEKGDRIRDRLNELPDEAEGTFDTIYSRRLELL